MDRRFLTVLGVSLVFALVVSSVFYQMTSRGNGPKRSEPTDTKDVVVSRNSGTSSIVTRSSPDGIDRTILT